MREDLKKINGMRDRFTGVFKNFGSKRNWHGFSERTVLLTDIRDKTGIVITDHLWFNYTQEFQRLGSVCEGQVIEFEARVKQYAKGYVNIRKGYYGNGCDYKLSYPTKVKIVNEFNNL